MGLLGIATQIIRICYEPAVKGNIFIVFILYRHWTLRNGILVLSDRVGKTKMRRSKEGRERLLFLFQWLTAQKYFRRKLVPPSLPPPLHLQNEIANRQHALPWLLLSNIKLRGKVKWMRSSSWLAIPFPHSHT